MPGTLALPTTQDPCQRCGRWAHEHDRERVQHENGTYSYDYYCPEGVE